MPQWHSTAQHSTAQHSTAQHSTAQHSTAQHSRAEHSTAQHSTAVGLAAHLLHQLLSFCHSWAGAQHVPHSNDQFLLISNLVQCLHHSCSQHDAISIYRSWHGSRVYRPDAIPCIPEFCTKWRVLVVAIPLEYSPNHSCFLWVGVPMWSAWARAYFEGGVVATFGNCKQALQFPSRLRPYPQALLQCFCKNRHQ